MKDLLRPTLVRRVFVALTIAFALVWVVLMLVQHHDDLQRIERDRQGYVTVLATTLSEARDDSEARDAIAFAERMTNGLRRQQGIPGTVLFQLWDAKAGPAPPPAPTAYDVMTHDAGRWAIRIAAPQFAESRWVRVVAGDMLRYLAIAFPLVLIPMWVAVSRGLQPLKHLSALIASRSPSDLSPLPFRAVHAELAPLAAALNQLLEQLHAKVAREHAFVQDAAHELRTPLAAIAAQAHVLGKATDAEDRGEAQAHLEQAVARTSHLIQQLLTLARVDASAFANVAEVNLAKLVRQELVQISRAATQRSIEISLEAPDQMMVRVNPLAFQSALHNLLDNAVRYGCEGGRICVQLQRTEGNIILQVLDDGPGIPHSERALMFERFHRGASHDVPGSGLGLAIVKQAAVRLGGEVHVNTGLDGKGCGFVVSWPIGAA